MKPFVIVLVLCILGFVSPQDAGSRKPTNISAISSPTGLTLPTRSGHPTVPKSREIVSTIHPTHTNRSAIRTPTKSQKTFPSHTTVPSGENVPTGHPTRRPLSTRNRKPKSPASRGSLPASSTRTPKPKTPVSSTTRTTSYQKPKATISRASYTASTRTVTPKQEISETTSLQFLTSPTPRRSYPASSTETRNSSTLQPPTTTTATNSTTVKNPKITSKPLSASRTLTVSNHQTVSAQVGWVIVGVGAGGSVAVGGGHVFEVAGGTAVIIEENSSGEDEPSTVSTSTSSSSSTASPTPYNIYPRPGSTRLQQSAFARNLEQIAQPGSVRSITGSRDKLLLWVASLTPSQASELNHDPVVSPLPLSILAVVVVLMQTLIRSGVLMWISYYRFIWKERGQDTLPHHQTVPPGAVRMKSEMELF